MLRSSDDQRGLVCWLPAANNTVGSHSAACPSSTPAGTSHTPPALHTRALPDWPADQHPPTSSSRSAQWTVGVSRSWDWAVKATKTSRAYCSCASRLRPLPSTVTCSTARSSHRSASSCGPCSAQQCSAVRRGNRGAAASAAAVTGRGGRQGRGEGQGSAQRPGSRAGCNVRPPGVTAVCGQPTKAGRAAGRGGGPGKQQPTAGSRPAALHPRHTHCCFSAV